MIFTSLSESVRYLYFPNFVLSMYIFIWLVVPIVLQSLQLRDSTLYHWKYKFKLLRVNISSNLVHYIYISSMCNMWNSLVFSISKLCSRKFNYYFRHEHPIVPIIKEHRTMAKLLNSTLGSICSLARLSVNTQKYTLHGHWLQTSTATGRLSMEEPNLQVLILLSVCFVYFPSTNCYI